VINIIIEILVPSLWYDKIATNNFFTFICGLITILGFLITIYISLKTKSINKKIKIIYFNKK